MSSPVPAAAAVRFGRLAPTVPVAGIARAVAFYTDRLGFRSVFQNGSPVGFVILKKDDAELHLTLRAGHRGSTSNVAHLLVDDAAALHDRLQAQGVRIIKAIRDADFGLRCFVFADPDGNRIDVGQPLPR
ncbi:glyoxalase superfamily protein [Xanthomonas sp. CFBP 8445]|uniref:VOC family protein n=1 Tax=Xanthomonas sp. CFBP 8445 TaxID=2971236 RepID=UPI0021DFEA89|nr:glyoxalase superfamily protein [Xanthomonas sp. CFBP 8445]UYC12241.1 glyoxalase superfamily protein [Xanthomonas sp. CFBP 8445]